MEKQDSPSLKCVFNLGAALSTTNFDFIAAVVCQYPHILKKIYLPKDYAAIALSSIVTCDGAEPVTTEHTIGFDIHLHLPYSI